MLTGYILSKYTISFEVNDDVAGKMNIKSLLWFQSSDALIKVNCVQTSWNYVYGFHQFASFWYIFHYYSLYIISVGILKKMWKYTDLIGNFTKWLIIISTAVHSSFPDLTVGLFHVPVDIVERCLIAWYGGAALCKVVRFLEVGMH